MSTLRSAMVCYPRIIPHPHANLIPATSSTAAPSAYAPSDTDPYCSGYEGDDELEPDSISWR